MTIKKQPLIGIDLGTTNSVVAEIDSHGRPTTIQNVEGDMLTPSVVYFEDSGPAIVGKEAIKAGLLDPSNVVEAVKRDMGKPFYRKPIRGKQLPPAAISGIILHRLVEDAAQRAGKFTRAVVTVPAYFNEPRRQATVEAAQMAGLKEVEILNEPTAAALAFGYQMGLFHGSGKIGDFPSKVPGQLTLLVYDLGGGTFDVTLMRIRDRHFQSLVCEGDVQLGGRDWDDRVVQYAVRQFEKETDVKLHEHPEMLQVVRLQCEDLKKTLTQRTKGSVRIQFREYRMSIEMTRSQLLELTADLLQRTRLTCELAMMDAKLSFDQLDTVLLVGGASRMPMVHDMLLELTGMEPNRSVSPDEAVAHGAALYSQMLWGEEGETARSDKDRKIEDEAAPEANRRARITNVNSHSLGVVGRDIKTNERRVSILIPKNTPLPHSNSRVFKTRTQGQEKVYFQIVEGESPNPDDCTVIGECRLIGLPNLPEGWPVTVAFAYRRDGRIFVEATVEGSEPFQVEIDRHQKISRKDLENWASEFLMFDEAASESDRGPKLPPSRIKVGKVKPKKKKDN